MSGWNPIAWDCARGCYNKIHRPKIELFSEVCFPRNIQMMDIDGTCEVNKHFLFMEWKRCPRLKLAQEIYFKHLTEISPRIVAFFVQGNAETMKVYRFESIRNGKVSKVYSYGTNIDQLKEVFSRWAQLADGNYLDRPVGHNNNVRLYDLDEVIEETFGARS
jgi:hypothetical protein